MSPVVDEGRMRDEARPLAGVSALSFLQCFDTAGWVTGRTSGPQESCATCPQGFCSGTGGE